MITRLAKVDDCHKLLSLIREGCEDTGFNLTFDEGVTMQTILTQLYDDDAFIFVTEIDGELVGSIAEDLGLSEDELVERAVNQMVAKLMTQWDPEEDGEDTPRKSPFAKKVQELVAQRIDEKVEELAGILVEPHGRIL